MSITYKVEWRGHSFYAPSFVDADHLDEAVAFLVDAGAAASDVEITVEFTA